MDKHTLLNCLNASWRNGVFDIQYARQQAALLPLLNSQCVAELVSSKDCGISFVQGYNPDTPLAAWLLMRKQREGRLTVPEQRWLASALQQQLEREERHPLCRRFDTLFPLCGAFLRKTPLNIFAWQHDPGPALLDEAEDFIMLVSGGCWYEYGDSQSAPFIAHAYEQEAVFEHLPLLTFLLTELLTYYRPANERFLLIAAMDFPLRSQRSYLLSWQRMIVAHLFEVLPADELKHLRQSLPVSLLTYLQQRYASHTGKQRALQTP
ncbi:hypothetical protein [Salinimonas lutimaris]|uniref:hypothetical protein n=1 Tax=Salinimonas lutimaris TaxID=914153 RepID=UPI0010C05493|nr:hypothetical protein [Salinimonas lutimaris]